MRQKSSSRNNKAAAINKRLDTSTSTNSKRKSIQRPSNGQRPSIVGQSNVSRMAQSLNKLSKPIPNKLNADSIMITIQNDEYVPVNTFIDMRNFKDFKELAFFLENISENKIDEYLCNINEFLKSDGFLKCTDQYFANELFHIVHASCLANINL